MYCTKCGNETADDAAFCRSCGAPTGKSKPVQKRTAKKPASKKSGPRLPFSRKVIGGAGGIIAIIIITVIVVATTGGGGGGKASNTPQSLNWPSSGTIEGPISVTISGGEESIGNTSIEQVRVVVPAGSFDTTATLTVSNPDNAPTVRSNELVPIGAPVEISVDGPVRLNEPATITFQIENPQQYAEDLQANSIWIAYYNGAEWEYFPPDKVDTVNGTISFETYHFSLFGKGKIDLEERLKQYTHTQAVSSLIQENVIDEAVDKVVEQVVEHILTDKLGISDKSVKFKVLASLANDDEYKDLLDQFDANDPAGFMQTLAVFAGGKIAENVEGSVLQGALETLASDEAVGLATAASQAAGYAAEGQYLEAGRILGGHIADQFLLTQLAKGAVEVVQYQIDTWKDRELEAAYNAYKNGADSKFWGYNVDPGDFDALWNQMRGIATRLQSEAVEREIKRREEYGMRPATDAELDAIRDGVREDLKKQFEERASQEAELEKREAKFQALIDQMQEANLLSPGRFGYMSAYDTVETRLDKLFYLSKKILRDTGREDWSTGAFSNEKEISMHDMISLMQAWYMTDGPKKYAELLKEKFGIDLGQITWELESTTPVTVAITEDTEDYFNHSFSIVPGLIQNGWQFTSYEAWGGKTEGYSCFVSMIGGWANPPASISNGETINMQVKLVPGWEVSQNCGSIPSGCSISIKFDGNEVGKIAWTRGMSKSKLNAGDSLGIFDDTITFTIPTDYKEEAFDIDAYAITPGGEGYLRYHYVKKR